GTESLCGEQCVGNTLIMIVLGLREISDYLFGHSPTSILVNAQLKVASSEDTPGCYYTKPAQRALFMGDQIKFVHSKKSSPGPFR
ncbi:MAG: hypothetical protein VW226_01455, partial [Rhodospirillaceae bacterium]